METYDCLVFSGGGAKGAYGAGVAKAIELYRSLRGNTNPICYVGTSAGALNAYILASSDADALIRFWLKVSNKDILGVKVPNTKYHGLRRLAGRLFANSASAYSIYAGEHLATLVGVHAKIEKVKAPLIIACTDYLLGALKAFYVSPPASPYDLIGQFCATDGGHELSKQRLKHFRRVATDDVLARVLTASCAIPIFFPPVEITTEFRGQPEKSLYVDGGVGNNTPTREAAYFLRYLEESGKGKSGLTYCVSQDPPRIALDEVPKLGLWDILNRTTGVYDYVHTKAIVNAWKRINVEVDEQQKRLREFEVKIEEAGLTDNLKQSVLGLAREHFNSMGGATSRLSMPLVEITPSTTLGDALNFDPTLARANIERGFTDTLQSLRVSRDRSYSGPRERTYINEAEFNDLIHSRIFA